LKSMQTREERLAQMSECCKKRARRRAEQGVCAWCGLNPPVTQRLCEKCRQLGRLYTERRKANYKAAVLKMYGDSCACCGEDNPKFLTVDHINGWGMSVAQRKAQGLHSTLYRDILREKSDNIQILCWNCNCGRAKNKGICPHKDGAVNESVSGLR
jgi:hypothetical protein